ncbi:MAG: hypothetical protein HYS56_00885 [Candidatus Omnitrophica bacterium]|nr:hypothetical protein [Candidatus Omnitrophota bacterium]
MKRFFSLLLAIIVSSNILGGSSPSLLAPYSIAVLSLDEAAQRFFSPSSTQEDHQRLVQFLSEQGEEAIHGFARLICEDRNISQEEFGPYVIPPYQGKYPPRGQISIGTDGRPYNIPSSEGEFARERLRLMAELAVQRALGRKVVTAVGIGHVGTAMMCVTADAVIDTQGRELGIVRSETPKFRRPLSGQVNPYFVAGYQRTSTHSSFKVDFVNAGRAPIESQDESVERIVRESRERGNLRATFLPESLSASDVILVETEVHVHKLGKQVELSPVELKATESLLSQVGSLAHPSSLIIVESTAMPGYTQNVVVPLIDQKFRERGLIPEGEHAKVAYSPQFLQPGPQWLKTLMEFKRYGRGVTDAATHDLEDYFKNVGFNYEIPESVQWAEFVKIADNALFYSLLEITVAFLESAEEMGLDAWKAIEAIISVRPDQRGFLKFVPQMQVGGYCIPKELIFAIRALTSYYGVSELEIMEIFKSRLVAANMSDFRAEKVVDKHLLLALSERGIPFEGARLGILGVAYKGGIADTRMSGSQRLAVRAADYGMKVEATDPFSRSWSEIQNLNPYDTTDWSYGLRNQQALRSLQVRYQPGPEGFLDFISPYQDAVVIATPHHAYFGVHQSQESRTVEDSEGNKTVFPGLDPVKAAARMLGLEGRVIMDTFNYLSDEDIRIFLALGWDVRALGKGHIDLLKTKLTLQDKIGATEKLLKELERLSDPEVLAQANKEGSVLRMEWITEAIHVAQAKLAYLTSQRDIRGGEGIQRRRLKLEYYRAKTEQELRFAHEAEQKALRMKLNFFNHADNYIRLIQDPDATEGKKKAEREQVKRFLTRYKNLKEEQIRNSYRGLMEKISNPRWRRAGALMIQNAQTMGAIGRVLGGSRLTAPGSAREIQRRLAELKYVEDQQVLLRNDLDRFIESLPPLFRSEIKQELARTERRPDLALSGRSTSNNQVDLLQLTEKEKSLGWRIVIQDRVYEDPEQEKARVNDRKKRGVYVIYRDTITDPETGQMLEFVPFTIYTQDSTGRIVKMEDPQGFSRARTVKWRKDAEVGKNAAISPLWSKFMVKVPLNIVGVEGKTFTPELFTNFTKLPLEDREWLMRGVFGRGKILSTVKGEKQSRYYLLMDVNLDSGTVARGRGGILMRADTDEPVVITTEEGTEQVVMLKASGTHLPMDASGLNLDTSRVVQGGRVLHDRYSYTDRQTGQPFAEIELYDGQLVEFPLKDGFVVFIRAGKIETIRNHQGDVVTAEFDLSSREDENGLAVTVQAKGTGESYGMVRFQEKRTVSAVILGTHQIRVREGTIAEIREFERGNSVLEQLAVSHEKLSRTSKTAMGQIPGHTREAAPDEILKMEGTPPYNQGKTARALLRLAFQYEGSDFPLQQLWRAVPSTARQGWMLYGTEEDFDPVKMTREMAWNAAEVLGQDLASVHIALNPDNIYSTGYFTDEDSQIPLYNERDPYGAFFKYFGYYMQLAYWDFQGAKDNNYDTIELSRFPEWVNAFLNHLLETRHGGMLLVRNPQKFQRFRQLAKGLVWNPKGLEEFENDFMRTLWQEYLAHHVLRNRLERGYDPTLESTYSGSEAKYRYDPNDPKKAMEFIQKQRELLTVAKRLIEEENYDPLYQGIQPFDFEAAFEELDRKGRSIDSLELLVGRSAQENKYADVYRLSFYPELKPNVFSLLDFNALKRGDQKLRLVIAQALPTVLKEKVDVALQQGLSATESRVGQLYFEGLEKYPEWGDFPLVPAYFGAWFSGEGPAEVTTHQDAERVYRQMTLDYRETRQAIPRISQLGNVTFSEPAVTEEGLEFSYQREDAIQGRSVVHVKVDLGQRRVFIMEGSSTVSPPASADEGARPAEEQALGSYL